MKKKQLAFMFALSGIMSGCAGAENLTINFSGSGSAPTCSSLLTKTIDSCGIFTYNSQTGQLSAAVNQLKKGPGIPGKCVVVLAYPQGGLDNFAMVSTMYYHKIAAAKLSPDPYPKGALYMVTVTAGSKKVSIGATGTGASIENSILFSVQHSSIANVLAQYTYSGNKAPCN